MTTPTTELMNRLPPQEKVTFDQFIEWCDEDTWAEWIDGEIILMPSPASIGHQDIGSFLEVVLRIYVETNNLGQVVRAPYVMKLAAISRGREPDLLFIKSDRINLLTRNYLDGPADVAIEIVSPESIGRDRGDKFVEYERVGIPEYWLIDPDRQSAEFYELGADGRYRLAPLGEGGVYRSQVISGFWLKVDWLWQTPLPPTLQILREMKVV